jgi:hypothetical protein
MIVIDDMVHVAGLLFSIFFRGTLGQGLHVFTQGK